MQTSDSLPLPSLSTMVSTIVEGMRGDLPGFNLAYGIRWIRPPPLSPLVLLWRLDNQPITISSDRQKIKLQAYRATTKDGFSLFVYSAAPNELKPSGQLLNEGVVAVIDPRHVITLRTLETTNHV